MAGPAYFDAFRRIVVQPDNITISADAVDDTLTLVAGAGISLVANANSDQITIVNTNSGQFSLAVAGDDSTLRTINSGETIRFEGTQNVTVSTDAEGKVIITGPNLSGYLTSESDPVFTASAAAGITNTNISNWNEAYSWGDHAVAGYLTTIPNDVTIGSVRINTNVIQTVDSNADLELDANGTGAVSVIGNLKVSGKIATTSNQIAIGNGAGSTSQGTYAVAVGYAAGQTNQGAEAIALGQGAGFINQGIFTVALGSNAGQLSQGNYAVSIGHNAGFSSQPATSIVINATGNVLNGSAAGLFIDPIRQVDTGLLLRYNTTTKEIIYSNDDITVGSISIENNLIKTTVSNADLELSASGTGAVSVIGNLFVGGLYTPSYQSLVAAGTDQAGATAISKNVVYVGSGSGGVRLPAVPSGTSIRIRNSLPGNLNVYPPTGGTISGSTPAGANNPLVQGGLTIKEYQYFGELDVWFVMGLL